MDVAVAIDTAGTVVAVELIDSDLENQQFERDVLAYVPRMHFGSAQGEGFYVFMHPFYFLTP